MWCARATIIVTLMVFMPSPGKVPYAVSGARGLQSEVNRTIIISFHTSTNHVSLHSVSNNFDNDNEMMLNSVPAATSNLTPGSSPSASHLVGSHSSPPSPSSSPRNRQEQ